MNSCIRKKKVDLRENKDEDEDDVDDVDGAEIKKELGTLAATRLTGRSNQEFNRPHSMTVDESRAVSISGYIVVI